MKKILIVDDDEHINQVLGGILAQEGYRVSHAYSGTEAALLLAGRYQPDLILLDLMLPGLSGEELLPKLAGIPVIVMSAKADVQGKVSLLLEGAVDYITKPFEIGELLARIAVQFRKAAAENLSGTLAWGELTLQIGTRQVQVREQAVKLTRTEFAILRLLMENPKQVIPKTVLLDRIGEDTPDCMESSLRVHISNLRKKLRDASGKDYIEAVWGVGFKLMEE